MGRRYAGFGQTVTDSGAAQTLLTMFGATTIRPAIYDLIMGSAATPAEQAAAIQLERLTAVGTEATGFTPVALDPDDPASLADCGVGNFSSEPTYTAASTLLDFGLHQKATYRWVAAPGGELIVPATAANGIGVKAEEATAAYNIDTTLHWME